MSAFLINEYLSSLRISLLFLLHWLEENGLIDRWLRSRSVPVMRVISASARYSPTVDHRGYMYGLEVSLTVEKPVDLQIQQAYIQVIFTPCTDG